VNKRELLPPQIIFTHQKEKKRKKKRRKKGYTLQTAREVVSSPEIGLQKSKQNSGQ